jgi:hypothetical protein
MGGRTNFHNEGRSSRPFVVNDYHLHCVAQNICERRRFTISEFSCEFPQSSRSVLYDIITASLSYPKFCVGGVPKILTGAHKTQNMDSVLLFYSDTTKLAMNFSMTS